MSKLQTSYTAASSYPIKVLLNRQIVDKLLNDKFIVPYHIQLNPESRCEENCPFCSCGQRDKSKRLTLQEIIDVFQVAKSFGGGGAATLTGDGNPTLHPQINDIIVYLKQMDVDLSLVNNGWSINRLSTEALNALTWMRISFGDGQRKKTPSYWRNLEDAVERSSLCDFSFSYVLTDKPDLNLIEEMIAFANRLNFSHIRIVSDIFNAKDLAPVMAKTKETIQKRIDDHLVIWQARDEWEHGVKDCHVSLLRPVLGSDGYWYSCCGDQYMLAEPSYCYVLPMSKLRCAEGLTDIIQNQKRFNGNICVKCYYESYNKLLGTLLAGVEHRRFV